MANIRDKCTNSQRHSTEATAPEHQDRTSTLRILTILDSDKAPLPMSRTPSSAQYRCHPCLISTTAAHSHLCHLRHHAWTTSLLDCQMILARQRRPSDLRSLLRRLKNPLHETSAFRPASLVALLRLGPSDRVPLVMVRASSFQVVRMLKEQEVGPSCGHLRIPWVA